MFRLYKHHTSDKLKKRDRISEAEIIVMDVIWNNGNAKASEIIEALSEKEKWNDKTIRTLLNRLVSKKVVGVKKNKFNEYYPLISREECLQEATISFLDRFYKGSIGYLVLNFVQNNQLSESEIMTLENLIEEKKKNDAKHDTEDSRN